MTSSVEKGNKLRDAVFSLVKAAQKDNCTTEKEIAGKNVDVYFEQPSSFHGTEKCVVECKSYNKSLGRDDISMILSHYIPCKPEFDYLLIITDVPLTPAVKNTLSSHEWVRHFTFDQFSDWLMSFSHYLRELKANFSNEGLSNYYVSIKDTIGNDIENKINDWIESNSNVPNAILAGYGMGKTSFAKKLAFEYANKFLKGEPTRIPILLKLGDIYNEQGLEGLICKYFSSKYKVPGFSYSLFLELNRHGRLLIVLDGFDEMKHAMSFSSFRAMMSEFNQLVVSGSKVIILGRPNIFTSEDEKASVLHGIRKVGTTEFKSAEMVDYSEIQVSDFDRAQLSSFVSGYLNYLFSERSTRSSDFLTPEFIEKRKLEILDKKYTELISRPVHARMLSMLSVSTPEDLSSFNRYQLYREFVDLFLERELQKPSRKNIDSTTRRQFIEDLAWAQWKKGGVRGFSYTEIAESSIKVEDAPFYQDTLRELVLGSVLESKGGDYFYFSHRSFQEYLVAEYIVRKPQWSTKELQDLSDSINSEVVNFINESGNSNFIFKSVYDSLEIYGGNLSWTLIQFLISHVSSKDDNKLNDFELLSPWKAFIHSVGVDINNAQRKFEPKNSPRLTNENKTSKLAVLIGITLQLKDATRLTDWGLFIVGTMLSETISIIEKAQINKNKLMSGVGVKSKDLRFWVSAMLTSVKPILSSNTELQSLTLNTFELYRSIKNSLAGHISFEDVEELLLKSDIEISYSLIESILPEYIGLSSNNNSDESIRNIKKKVRAFWRCKPELSQFVTVEERSNENKREIISLKK
ncbi:MAG: NACHT domain-containing protein [Pseudomonadales bacterium]